MNDFELQQLLQQQQQQPQFTQGFLGGGQTPQNSTGRGTQIAQAMVQQADNADQALSQSANNVQAQMAQTGQQAMQAQQAQNQKGSQLLGLAMKFLPWGKWLGNAGKALGIGK